MLNFALGYAEGNPAIAAVYIMGITLVPIMLADYYHLTTMSRSRSIWFYATLLWAGAVGADISGLVPLFQQGLDLPQIASR